MFLSLQHREDLGLSEPEVVDGQVTVLPNGVTNTKQARIKKLRSRDVEETSFTENSEKERALLGYLERFVTAFHKAHPHRKKLFVAPYNECGIPKFVCTTIRPTKLPHVEMYHAKSCAKFIAGFLNFEPLTYATEVPRFLPSPRSVTHPYAHAHSQARLVDNCDAYVPSEHRIGVAVAVLCVNFVVCFVVCHRDAGWSYSSSSCVEQ